jgi:hypothetical protein
VSSAADAPSAASERPRTTGLEAATWEDAWLVLDLTSASVSATVYDDASLPVLLPSSESRSGRGSVCTGDVVVHASVGAVRVSSVFCGETLLSTEEEDGLTDLPARAGELMI